MIRIVRRPLVVLSLLALPLFASNAFAEAPPAGPAHAHAQAAHAHARGGWMEGALALGSLRPDQKKQIEQLKTSVEPSRAAAKAARKGLLEGLATQVAGGKIDRAALQPKVDAVLASATAERTAERAALEKLHGILDAKQRAELASTMEARMAKHGGGKHASSSVHLPRDLKLTDAQKKQITDALAGKAAPARDSAQAKKVAEAFKQEKFAIDAIAPNDARAQAQLQAGHLLDVAQAATPVLTADQRNVAAAHIRANAAKGANLAF